MRKKNSPYGINFACFAGRRACKIIPLNGIIPQGKKNKGSALVVSLLVLAMILISALSIALVAVKERKASMGSAVSNKAYQAADTGIEEIMHAITRGNFDYVNNIGSESGNGLSPNLDESEYGVSCDETTGLIKDEDGLFTVELKKDGTGIVPCNVSSETLVSEIDRIKSVGIASGAKRAVEAVVTNKITKLLLHFNEDVSDYSFSGHGTDDEDSLSLSSEDGGKFDEAVLFGLGSYLKVESAGENVDDFNFTDKDFTIETWVKIDATAVTPAIVSQWGENKQFRFYYDASGNKLAFEYSTDGSNEQSLESDPINDPDLTDGGWYHVAVERKSGKVYFFVDGESQGIRDIDADTKIEDQSGKSIYIGASLNGEESDPELDNEYQFLGNMDEFRITKGVARWTEDGLNLWEIEYAPNN